jgi:CBS domain-containing protein
MSHSANSILKAFSVKSPLFPNDAGAVIRVFEENLIPEAFKKMTEHHVMCVPVVKHTDGSLVRMLSITDLINLFLKLFPVEELKKFDHHDLIHSQEKINKMKAGEVAAWEEPVVEVSEESTLLDAVKLMLDKKVHRVVVLNEHKRPTSVITQSRVVKLLSVGADSYPKSKKTLKELNLGLKSVITVPETGVAYDAFKLMLEKKVSAVGVVDENGVLKGSLSVNDIKGLGFSLAFFELLGCTNKTYLDELRLRDLQRTIPDARDPVVCKSTDSLEKVINTIQYYRIHRIYVVDDAGKPIGVVSLYDLLQELVKDDVLIDV